MERAFPATLRGHRARAPRRPRAQRRRRRAAADRVRRPRGPPGAAAVPARAAPAARRRRLARDGLHARRRRARARCAARLRDRVEVVTAAESPRRPGAARAPTSLVAASVGQAPAPGLLVRALGAGAIPVASRLPAYEEVLRDGERGLLFEPGDVDTLAAQLARLLDRRRACAARLARRRRGRRAASSPGARVAERFEAVYDAGGRPPPPAALRRATCARGSPRAS